MRFEVPKAGSLAAWLWVPLLALIAMPFPLLGYPLPERAVPIMWLMLAGAAALFLRVAEASWPLAALLAWALARSAYNSFPVRSSQLLLLTTLVAVLYVAARQMPSRVARYAAWALAVGVLYEGVFGFLNIAFKWYPFMTFVLPDHVGRPMAFLTHPNYWGSFMALGMPVVWALLGPLAALPIYAMILWSWSAGPAISASAGILVLVWPDLSARLRAATLGGIGAALVTVMSVHEWRLSGRWEVWASVLPELKRYWLIGQGLGDWRVWADNLNLKMSQAAGGPVVFATLQAHNEPLQLWFELGLVGVVLAGLVLWQAERAARGAWRTCPPGSALAWRWGRMPLERAWLAVLAVGLTNSLGSPTFHLPAQAAFVLFALARVQAAAVPAPVPPVAQTPNGRHQARAERRRTAMAPTGRL